jgi:hypothetical protein
MDLQVFFSPEEGDGMCLQNVGIYMQVHMALQSSRSTEMFFTTVRTSISYHLGTVLPFT